MKCPSCGKSHLGDVQLSDRLNGKQCGNCNGIWIAHKQYETWQASLEAPLPEKAYADVHIDVEDKPGAKVCPECSRILLKYKVGHGLDFYLDHCSACGGVWLDAKEWEALKSKNLHDELHRIFSTSWQNQVREESLAQTMEEVFTKRFGKEPYDKLCTFKSWLDGQSTKAEMIAFLREG